MICQILLVGKLECRHSLSIPRQSCCFDTTELECYARCCTEILAPQNSFLRSSHSLPWEPHDFHASLAGTAALPIFISVTLYFLSKGKTHGAANKDESEHKEVFI